MKMEFNTKQPPPKEFKVLERGKRSLLHPNLKVIDNFDCHIEYNIRYKYFVVDYMWDGEQYTKTMYSDDIKFILEILFEK